MLRKIIPCILLVLLCGCSMKEYPPCRSPAFFFGYHSIRGPSAL